MTAHRDAPLNPGPARALTGSAEAALRVAAAHTTVHTSRATVHRQGRIRALDAGDLAARGLVTLSVDRDRRQTARITDKGRAVLALIDRHKEAS